MVAHAENILVAEVLLVLEAARFYADISGLLPQSTNQLCLGSIDQEAKIYFRKSRFHYLFPPS